MKIRIKAPFVGAETSGIYGADGKEIPIGTELEFDNEPTDWAGRYDVIKGTTEGKTAVVNPELDRDELKKQAAELGLEYAPNISTPKLKDLIDAKLAE